jgi:hypothetical protein
MMMILMKKKKKVDDVPLSFEHVQGCYPFVLLGSLSLIACEPRW